MKRKYLHVCFSIVRKKSLHFALFYCGGSATFLSIYPSIHLSIRLPNMFPSTNIYPLSMILPPPQPLPRRCLRSRRSMMATCLPHFQVRLCRTLIRACQEGDYHGVRRALLDGADPNYTTARDGMTPLHWAVERDHVEILELLLSGPATTITKTTKRRTQDYHNCTSMANVDSVDSYRCTPLSTACQRGNLTIVDVLLRHGADPNFGDGDGWTPLHWTRSPEVAARLLRHGDTDVDAKDKDGETPLHVKIGDEDLDVASVLLHHGADIRAHNARNMTPLQMAARLLDVAMVRRILQSGATLEGHECCTDPTASQFSSSLWMTCPNKSGHYFLKYRMEDDEYFIAKNKNTTRKKLTLAKLVFQYGNGVDPTRIYPCCGRSPLHHVCFCCCPEPVGTTTTPTTTTQRECCTNTDMLQIVLPYVSKDKINVKSNDDEGLTPLHVACRAGRGGGGSAAVGFSQRRIDMVRLLLENGADLHVKTNHGQTPLMMACQDNDVDLVRFLLTRWEPSRIPLDSTTILSYACANSNVNVVRLMCEEFHMKIDVADQDCHLRRDASNSKSTPRGCPTPLEASCAAEQLDTIFYLVRDQRALSLSLSLSISRRKKQGHECGLFSSTSVPNKSWKGNIVVL